MLLQRQLMSYHLFFQRLRLDRYVLYIYFWIDFGSSCALEMLSTKSVRFERLSFIAWFWEIGIGTLLILQVYNHERVVAAMLVWVASRFKMVNLLDQFGWVRNFYRFFAWIRILSVAIMNSMAMTASLMRSEWLIQELHFLVNLSLIQIALDVIHSLILYFFNLLAQISCRSSRLYALLRVSSGPSLRIDLALLAHDLPTLHFLEFLLFLKAF